MSGAIPIIQLRGSEVITPRVPVIEHAGGRTRLALYNRAIMLFSTGEEFYKQVHCVSCAIQKGADVAQSP